MTRFLRFLFVRLLLLLPALANAQTPGGDGLMGQYYDGENFERVMYIRRDPTIDFDWGHGEPAPGLPTEYFSVRWKGWLVPPATGRYIFHITIDDGMRIWLNDRQIFNEWRGQPVTSYAVSVELKAGVPYRLRVDYFQSILDTRAKLTWEIPQARKPESSWRNGWGIIDDKPVSEPISSRYLFSKEPPKPLPPTKPIVPIAKPAPKPAPKPVASSQATGGPAPAAAPRRATPPPPVPPPVAPVAVPAPVAAPDSAKAQVSRLADGETVTLPDLYFEQGKAVLPPATRATLDALAKALSARPSLQLEVQGHTDNVGNAELNRQLSQQRAEAVCLYLTAHGVAAERLRPVGYGGTHPVADNADPAQRPKNRRVALVRL